MIQRIFPFLCLFFVTCIFFWQFLFKGLLPIPGDTIIGLYHPYRDLYAKDYPNGISFKNFLITDPVRQQYPWREFSITGIKSLGLPTWNPYSFSGTPNLANFQSAVFYPLNILFLILPFQTSWSFLILAQPFLAGIFMFLYLRNLKLDNYSSFFGSITFSFGGFFATWLEWGTVLHTALWLPLVLLSIDKISKNLEDKKKLLIWSAILILGTSASFFSGHLQTFFYFSLLGFFYLLGRIWQNKSKKLILIFLTTWLLTLSIISIQLIPSLKFILLSARDVDQLFWQKEGWFIPWQHLVSFLSPDFFGNPTTLNFWGTWNYGELTTYIGVLPFLFGIYAMLFRKEKRILFFGSVLLVSLIFALPTPIAKLPFIFDIPFLSTAQPTRLIFLINFSLAVLSALGLNYLIKSGRLKQILTPVILISIIYFLMIAFTLVADRWRVDPVNLVVAKRNIYLPMILFASSVFLIILYLKTAKKYKSAVLTILIIISVIDLFRFSWKFNTFSDKKYLYPSTETLDFVSQNISNYRIASADPRIMPPNFSMTYGIQTVEGYDPLFLSRYGEFISAVNREKADIEGPFGFNRIVRVEKYDSNLVDLLGIKFVLSFSELNPEKYKKVFEEGQTKVYENKDVIDRVFFVSEIQNSTDKNKSIKMMFAKGFNPKVTAVIEDGESKKVSLGVAVIREYGANRVVVETKNEKDGFLVLTDSFYPTWHARIDESKEFLKIYRTDYAFRGVFVPAGSHTVTFYNTLL